MEDGQFLLTERSVLSRIEDENEQITLKRRWLLGLSTSESEIKKLEREDKIHEARASLPMPESFIRGDDVFLETAKSRVEKALGIISLAETERETVLDALEFPGTNEILRVNDMTTNGLGLLVETLTGNQIKFEKTRHKMKKMVRELLPLVFSGQNNNNNIVFRQVTKLLGDPKNFRDNRLPFFTAPPNLIQRAAAEKVLGELESIPSHTLAAMLNKLKGKRETKLPPVKTPKIGFGREQKIKQVRKRSKKMLSELGEKDQLPEPLVKAMAVAGLSSKLTPGPHYHPTEFYEFSSEIENLQNEIMKAFWLVEEKKVSIPVLESVENLFDQNPKVPKTSLRSAVKSFLTEYLFICDDFDPVPETVVRILAMINKDSRGPHDAVDLKKLVEEETECVLNVSAHGKQILLDLLPETDLGENFADAYMEDLVESDEEDCLLDFSRIGGPDEEGAGDTDPNDSKKICDAIIDQGSKSAVVDGLEAKICSLADANNRYLDIQETCDKTSLTAFDLIGRLIEEFKRKELPDQQRSPTMESDALTMVRVTEELIPSLPSSAIENLKRLLGS